MLYIKNIFSDIRIGPAVLRPAEHLVRCLKFAVRIQYFSFDITLTHFQEWIQNNNVLTIVLRDSLHQPQYVEKLEKILRFMIKEKTLTSEDLDKLWEAQSGKHDAIVKNVHDLLAKLAWDFSPEQLDHLFECFQVNQLHTYRIIAIILQ